MANDLSKLNDIMFNQIDRLDKMSIKDPAAMEAEIARARTMKGLAETVISNGNLVLRAAQTSMEAGEMVQVPRMLAGGPDGR